MARKRMIGEIVYCDDDFIGLKAEAKLLYTYLVLSADDYGLTNGIKKILFLSGADEEDLKSLINEKLILDLGSGVYAVAHWWKFNRVQESKRSTTQFLTEFKRLGIDENEIYNLSGVMPEKYRKKSGVMPETGREVSAQYSIGQSQSQYNSVQDSTVEYKEVDNDAKTAESFTHFLDNDEFKKLKNYFVENICALRTVDEFTILHDLLNDYGYDMVVACIDITKEKKGQTVQYLEKVCASNTIKNR